MRILYTSYDAHYRSKFEYGSVSFEKIIIIKNALIDSTTPIFYLLSIIIDLMFKQPLHTEIKHVNIFLETV